MMVIKDKYYYPNNSILVICGDVKHEAAFQMAKNIFGDWKNSGFDPHQKYPIPEFKPLTKSEFFVTQNSIAATPYMMYQWQGPDYRNDSAATVAADVFSTILGLNSSKWQQSLIDKGLASYAGLQYQTLKYVGPVTIFVVPNPDKIKECHEEIMKQLAAFTAPGYFTNEQLEDAKGILLRNQVRNSEKPSSLPMQMTYHWCSTSLDYFTDLTKNYQKVTEADIRRYIDRYITGKPFVAGIIINEEMNKKYNPAAYFNQK
jgi:zinc protease